MKNADNKDYYGFTGPARLDKAMNSLDGLLAGIAADRAANEREIALLSDWVNEHRSLQRRHPFNEIVPRIDQALSDGVFDPEEMADVRWLCGRLTSNGGVYYDAISADMQQLHGILSGVAADTIISMEELDALSDWLTGHEHLKSYWPYDEVESLLTAVRKDKFIDAKEHSLLVRYFSEFTAVGGHRALTLPLNEATVPVTGMCAVCPDIQFVSRLFCFTGSSQRCTRKELAEVVKGHGADFTDTLRKDVDYLVIGADGNSCWAYSCYGRKVEQAIEHRKKGSQMLLVHECDFWDAIENKG